MSSGPVILEPHVHVHRDATAQTLGYSQVITPEGECAVHGTMERVCTYCIYVHQAKQLEAKEAEIRAMKDRFEDLRKAAAAQAPVDNRWEVGFRSIVTTVLGSRMTFDIPNVVAEVRKLMLIRDTALKLMQGGCNVTELQEVLK